MKREVSKMAQNRQDPSIPIGERSYNTIRGTFIEIDLCML